MIGRGGGGGSGLMSSVQTKAINYCYDANYRIDVMQSITTKDFMHKKVSIVVQLLK